MQNYWIEIEMPATMNKPIEDKTSHTKLNLFFLVSNSQYTNSISTNLSTTTAMPTLAFTTEITDGSPSLHNVTIRLSTSKGMSSKNMTQKLEKLCDKNGIFLCINKSSAFWIVSMMKLMQLMMQNTSILHLIEGSGGP